MGLLMILFLDFIVSRSTRIWRWQKWLAKEKESIEDNRYCGEKGQRVLTEDEGEFIESNWRLG